MTEVLCLDLNQVGSKIWFLWGMNRKVFEEDMPFVNWSVEKWKGRRSDDVKAVLLNLMYRRELNADETKQSKVPRKRLWRELRKISSEELLRRRRTRQKEGELIRLMESKFNRMYG